ncbi:MAG TPA: aminotransferase class III-fold pyridoxal phosphate-dependent enzyme, partial [Usitatibacter sp.]
MDNREMVSRSLAAVWHPCTQMKSHERFPLVPVARAEGPWLQDFEGRRYLDAVSSWWVNLFGHSHPYINAALRDQLDSLEHVMLAGFTHAPVVELAERLSSIAPGALGHAFFASDGASATEIALKMAFHYWANRGRGAKRRFVSLQGGYHGETAGALGVTDVPIFRDAYGPLLHPSIVAPFPARGEDDHRFGGAKGAAIAA